MIDRMKETNFQELKNVATKSGAVLFGIVDFEKLKHCILDISENTINKLKYVIVTGVRLSNILVEDIDNHPTKLYFYHYRQINYLLDRIALDLVTYIQSNGYSALPIPSSQTVDWEKQKGHFSHKHAAVESGLGWIGRNNLFVCKDYGAQVRLVTVLTDIPLITNTVSTDLSCGECRSCISICPASAIKESYKDFDAKACYQQLDVFRKKHGIGHHICGVCVKVCKGEKK